jgi:Leucine-rich repeat (LRR) protein
MKTTLNNWLSQQNDMEEYFFRFLKSGEFVEELNTFFEIKNKIPIAITAVGAIIYAEFIENDVLFSIYYMDQHLDFHLSDSIEDFEKLLQRKTSKDFKLHIDIRELNELTVNFGALQAGEIYGYSDTVFDEEIVTRSASHTISPRQVSSTSKQNAKNYISKICKKFQEEINNRFDDFYCYPYDGISYEYSNKLMISYNIDEFLTENSINELKSIYKCFSSADLTNLRSFSNSSLELLQGIKRLNYFAYRDYFLGDKIKDIFALLQHNSELLSISLVDENSYQGSSAMFKSKIESYEALTSFPLLKRIIVDNVEMTHFPEALTQLQNLEIICLFKTGIKSLPESLSKMTELKQLRLSEFSLDGKLDAICELKALKALVLKQCELKSLPNSLQQLSELEYLDLSNNIFTELPEWIGAFKHLKTLKLSNCGLTELPSSIGELPQIQELEIKGNKFKSLPKTLLKLKSKVKVEPKFKALYDEKVAKKMKELGKKPAVFTDFGFKLMVIQSLMYEKELLLPKFDVHEFVENYTTRKIDIEEEGYDMIPEVKAYFEQLEIPIVLLDEVEELNADGGDDIYAQISPLWGGEDDYYLVYSAKDAKQFENLKKVSSLFFAKKNVTTQFEKLNITVE